MTPAGFPHSDIPGSQLGCQLPRAYRRLLRPSSALDAKASTMCPSQLATTNTTPHPQPHHTPPTQQGTKSARMFQAAQVTSMPAHYKDARVHYPDLKQQPHTTSRSASHEPTTWPGRLSRARHQDPHPLLHPTGTKRDGATDVSEPQQCAPTTSRNQHPAPNRDHAPTTTPMHTAWTWQGVDGFH